MDEAYENGDPSWMPEEEDRPVFGGRGEGSGGGGECGDPSWMPEEEDRPAFDGRGGGSGGGGECGDPSWMPGEEDRHPHPFLVEEEKTPSEISTIVIKMKAGGDEGKVKLTMFDGEIAVIARGDHTQDEVNAKVKSKEGAKASKETRQPRRVVMWGVSSEYRRVLSSKAPTLVIEYLRRGDCSWESPKPVSVDGFYMTSCRRRGGGEPTNPLWVLKKRFNQSLDRSAYHWEQRSWTPEPLRLRKKCRFSFGGVLGISVLSVNEC